MNKIRHIARRSGVGMRQAITPKPKKARGPKRTYGGPLICGAINPERPGIVDHETGEELFDAIVCTARLVYDLDGLPRPHAGKHRNTVLAGRTTRWGA